MRSAAVRTRMLPQRFLQYNHPAVTVDYTLITVVETASVEQPLCARNGASSRRARLAWRHWGKASYFMTNINPPRFAYNPQAIG
jgi:hypothetical protein